ncbi:MULTISPECIES: hypothetical protein [unclassified Tolypothrix]|uniref:hypothetical protein n=1 Tax=unclassified Tolypothrix TaxID=2649714 RepID=UPI000B19D157|nr:Na+/H+ antiporter [Microchaete diplosiphon NIES-3275]
MDDCGVRLSERSRNCRVSSTKLQQLMVSGTLDKPLQAAIVIIVILTTFLAPSLLRFAFKQSVEPQEPIEQADLLG